MSLFIFGTLGLFVFCFIIYWSKKGKKKVSLLDAPVDWDNAYNRKQLTEWFVKKQSEYNDNASFIRYISETYGKEIAIKHITLSILSMKSAPLDSAREYNMATMKAKIMLLQAENYRDEFCNRNSFSKASLVLAATASM